MSDVKAALNELPAPIRKFAALRIMGIVIVRELGTTADTETIHGQSDGKEVKKAFIVLDQKALDQKANSWLAWKEGTPFKADPSYRIEGKIENEPTNDRVHAIQYIVLHEIGHVIAAVGKLGPTWESWDGEGADAGQYPFSRISWFWAEGLNVSRFEGLFPLREKVAYYRAEETRLPFSEAKKIYQQLMLSDFSTLYAATNVHDDFAEAFANYVHVVVMKKPYELRFIKDGANAVSYGACWQEKRCAAKRAFLDQMFVFVARSEGG